MNQSHLYDDEVYKDNLSLTLFNMFKTEEICNPKQKALIVDDVQEVAKISNIFYRDFNTNEINDLKSQLLRLYNW